MKAWRVAELTDDFSGMVFEDTTLPNLGANQVHVRLRATVLGFPDLLMTQGKYQLKPDLPFTPGMEAAGIVLKVGENISHIKPGDRVVAGTRLGGFAEEAVCEGDKVRKIPDTMSFSQASAYHGGFITAYVALVRRGHLQAGETLLVHGAAGGMGQAAVDLGKMLGATVIATAGSDEKCAFLKDLGADHVINYTNGFREQVKALTGGEGADVIFDPVGGDIFDESIRCIAWGGRILIIGFTSGRIPTIGVNMPLIKGFSVVGVRAGEYGRRDPVKGAENSAQVDKWAFEGKIQAHIGAEYPLEQLIDALKLMRDRKAMGRIVVTMNDG